MRKTMIIGAAVALMAGSAVAQSQNPPANPGPGNPAVNTTGANNPGAPVVGANSFTEGQAKSRIESSGYGNVTDLKKDDNGVWRGKAQKDGKSVDVTLDFQGNVVAR
jgi:opacity protein-like surface antigen